jgi:hypothetical protein
METRRLEELARMGLDRHVAPVGGKPFRLRDALDEAGLV